MIENSESLDERISGALSTLKEGCHFNVAATLYPDLIGEADEFKAKMDETAILLKSMEARGLVESAGEFAGVEFFRPVNTDGKNQDNGSASENTEKKAVRSMENVEKTVIDILRKGGMTASDVAGQIFPRDKKFRARTSQIFVCLKRLEKKGAIVKGEKQGKKQYYVLAAPVQTDGGETKEEESHKRPEPKEMIEIDEAIDEDTEGFERDDSLHFEAPKERKTSVAQRGLAVAALLVLLFSFMSYTGAGQTSFFTLPAPGSPLPLALGGAALLVLFVIFVLARRKSADIKALKAISTDD